MQEKDKSDIARLPSVPYASLFHRIHCVPESIWVFQTVFLRIIQPETETYNFSWSLSEPCLNEV